MMKLAGKSILLISPEAWGLNFVSKHHYANYLSECNTIYFLNPAVGFSKLPFGKMCIEIKHISKSLSVITYKNKLPRLNSRLWPLFLRKIIYRMQAAEIQREINKKSLDIIWSFDPYRFTNQRKWAAKNFIYHSVDFHPEAKREKEIINTSDHYFCTANSIIESVNSKKKAIHIGHGSDIEGFENDENIQLPGSNNLKAAYIGNFNEKVDYKLLKKITQENIDVDFIMIGPTNTSNLSGNKEPNQNIVSNFSNCKNIHFIGSVEPKKLMIYLKKADINLVIYKKNEANPHKLMSYFFAGKVTLSSPIDEYKNTPNELMVMADSNDDIPALFIKIKRNLAYYNSASLKNKRRAFSIENSYDKKIDKISSFLKIK